MQNKIAILGSDSFIGRALKENIKSKKKFLFYNKENLGNFLLKKTYNKINVNVDKILLLASKKDKNKKKTYIDNINILKNNINFCVKNNIHLVFMSTYIPNTKKNKLKLNYYQKSKLDSEIIIKKNKLLKYTILRLPNIYGEINYNKKPNNFIDKLINSIKNKDQIDIFKPYLYRSYLNVNDLSKFLNLLLNDKLSIKRKVNLNVFSPISTYSLLKFAIKLSNKDISYNLIDKAKNNSFNYFHKNIYLKKKFYFKNNIHSFIKSNL